MIDKEDQPSLIFHQEDENEFNPNKNGSESINLSEYLEKAYDKFGGGAGKQPNLEIDDDNINFDDPQF